MILCFLIYTIYKQQYNTTVHMLYIYYAFGKIEYDILIIYIIYYIILILHYSKIFSGKTLYDI